MTRDQEIWGVAHAVLARYGDVVDDHIGRRIADLTADGVTDGVAMWREVARRIETLRKPPGRA